MYKQTLNGLIISIMFYFIVVFIFFIITGIIHD